MPQLLLELFSEEIPARMQAGAARELERMAREGLAKHELAFESLSTFAGPRRLTLLVEGLPAATPDRTEELKGPKANAPPQALEGFLRKTGLSREALIEREGVFYATVSHTGRPTPEIAAEIVGEVMRAFPWPKSMRSGSSTFRWVRPLKRVLFLVDGEVVPFEIDGITADDVTEGHRFMGSKAPFSVSTFDTYQQRLTADFVRLDTKSRKQHILEAGRAACAARGLELVEDEGLLDEVAGLAEWPTPLIGDMDPAFLDLPPEVIRTSMRTHQKYFAVRPAGAGERNQTGLAPHFLVVANIEASDGGEEIRRGNAKVLSARLSDARFFWDEDRKAGAFEKWLGKLAGVTFHAKLGTMAERVERIAALAEEIAPSVGADPKLAKIAARLAKADLASAMVGEFPELQGVMGGYYVRQAPYSPFPLEGGRVGDGGAATTVAADLREASAPLSRNDHRLAHTPIPSPSPLEGEGGAFEGKGSVLDGQEDPLSSLDLPARQGQGAWWDGLSRLQVDQIADAVRDHYKPVGPSDTVPTAPVTVAVALADKLDTLVGFFAIDEKPTGSKDPYALRRAALGVIRLMLAARSTAGLAKLIEGTFDELLASLTRARALRYFDEVGRYYPLGDEAGLAKAISFRITDLFVNLRCVVNPALWHHPDTHQDERRDDAHARLVAFDKTLADLLSFFADRLKVLLRDEGKRHDLVDAVFALGDDDLVRIVDRVEALSAFLATEDGANLLAGYKRAVNILRAEQKKNPTESYAPLPLEGGEVGRGGEHPARASEGTGGAFLAQTGNAAASTPIPGPSPLEGEGRAIEEDGSEAALAATLAEVARAMRPLLAAEDFAAAMTQLAKLRGPVDAFFDKVLVNDPDAAVRLRRLRLLATIQATANQVADFSLIQG